MPRGYPSLFPEQKREIIARIKEKGERVADLAQEYGVQPRIIYGYLNCSIALKYPPAVFAQRINFQKSKVEIFNNSLIHQKIIERQSV